MQSQKLKIAFLVCFMFFYCIDSGVCYFIKPITFSLWRKYFELDEETNAGLCWHFSVKWINKTRNADEQELGFGHVHKTGSAVFFGKSSTKFSLGRIFSCLWKPGIKQASIVRKWYACRTSLACSDISSKSAFDWHPISWNCFDSA